MALPLLQSVRDAADFNKTVAPFIPQLYELPARLLSSSSLSDLRNVYVETNPLISAFAISVALGFVFLVVSEINRNYSQVDRMWSILPNLYIVHMALWARQAGAPSDRITLVAIFSTLWSIRLTYNYARRGGYNVGSEDYRWEILQQYVPKWIWFIFNVTFISFIQSVLLLAFSGVPAYAILVTTQFEPTITAADYFFFAVLLALIYTEWTGDGHQYHYQTAKYQYRDDGKLHGGYTQAELERGFSTKGLFAYSRHPSFFAEQSIWFVLYQWACFSTSTFWNWTFIGSGSLILLFQGSTLLTEWITSGKYVEYKYYKEQVPMFLPSPRFMNGYTPPDPEVIAAEKASKQLTEESKKQK